MRIQLSSSCLDSKEICKNVKSCLLSQEKVLFFFYKNVLFMIIYCYYKNGLTNIFKSLALIVIEYYNNIYSNMINIDNYKQHK